MASSSNAVDANSDHLVPEWKLACEGIKLLINNKGHDAENLFLKYPDSMVMISGYSYAVFMDALMTFEDDKLSKANDVLRDVEKRCTVKNGWLKSVSKVFGYSSDEPRQSLTDILETQIILADSQVCLGTLTFLQNDISGKTGIFKGGWCLRKAWKIYQKVYNEIKSLYEKEIGPLQLPDPENTNSVHTSSEENLDIDWKFPDPDIRPTNGYIPKTKIPQSKSAILNNHSNNFSVTNQGSAQSSRRSSTSGITFIKKSTSFNSGLTDHVDKEGFWNSRYSSLKNSMSFNYLKSIQLFSSENIIQTDIDKDTIKRLMAGVSFGYGLLQLGISLLPPSVLRLTNIFGFNADRQNGIACLLYARTGEDMRASLATLALLWYHTIVRPFYAVDGSNVKAGAEAAAQLLTESEAEFSESAIFLFFKGRMHRISSDIPSALKCFQDAVDHAAQREIKLLALHEEGWCNLITLDFCSAKSTFLYLKSYSRWSKPFYNYVAALCAGVCDELKSCCLFEELKANIKTVPKGNQLTEFLLKRSNFCPQDNLLMKKLKPIYWKFLLYEMLYLWNALPSCNADSIEIIIEDCERADVEVEEEPIKGISYLILGSCYCIKRNIILGKENFRKCLEVRSDMGLNASDAHVSAFSQYELASLLIKSPETKDEGKKLLQEVNLYNNYDFEQRLSVRVNSLLKQI